MTKLRFMASAIFVAAVVACFAIPTAGQTEVSIANVSGGGSAAKWDISTANNGGTLTISFPDGRSIRKAFRGDASPHISIGDKYFEALPDGVYTYELQLASAPSDEAIKARGKDDDPENERAARKRPSVPAMTQSGSFAVVNGSIVVAGSFEPEQKRDAKASTGPAAAPATWATTSPNMLQRIRYNHRAFFKPDFVIADDLVVQGSACVGLDCVNNEPFSFDTIRMKENNTRILFLDTSTASGFATNDWIIRANSSASGGGNFLGIVDHANAGTGAETGTIIAQFDAGAPANSLRVSSTGRVGLRTATPVLALHINEADTPDIRLEQNNTGGFTAQTWDIAGNEANFFVRDVTGGSRLPFRIRPGAPTSSIDIAASGNVGIGTASPLVKLHSVVSSNNTSTAPVVAADIGFAVVNSDTTANNLSVISFANSVSAGQAQIGSVNLGSAATSGGHMFFTTRAAGGSLSERMRLTSAGRLGIGTNAPDQVLSVNGDASKAGGGSWLVFSDERLKLVKGDFNSGLKAIMQLQPLRYEYRPDNALNLNSAGEHVGFGAQAVQKVIPEAVTTTDSGYLQVNNDPILWAMLNAIKEQQAEIAELKKQVRQLRAGSRRRR